MPLWLSAHGLCDAWLWLHDPQRSQELAGKGKMDSPPQILAAFLHHSMRGGCVCPEPHKMLSGPPERDVSALCRIALKQLALCGPPVKVLRTGMAPQSLILEPVGSAPRHYPHRVRTRSLLTRSFDHEFR